MHWLQMGLGQKNERTLEPWLCYYCGQCSEQCPREAYPGETMMSMRRWLISRYDFTGLAGLFFKSALVEMLFIIIVAILTGIFLFQYGLANGDLNIYDGAGAFLPSPFIHKFDLAIGLVMLIFLSVNAFRMWYFTMVNGMKIPVPLWLYVRKLYELPWHFFTQKRYSDCEAKRNQKMHMPWIIHLGLMLGYVTMLLLVMVFIESFQSGPDIQWAVHIFGYLASIGLLTGTIYFIWHRVTKGYIQYKKSHSTDWIFIILLFFIVVTGITQHIFHRSGLYNLANFTYIFHLMCVVPWLLRMPFSKWSHMIYRPLAMYFSEIQKVVILKEMSKNLNKN
jgi:heterodisulfide reductase subunit C/quinone-modifying oxidoreductase subunit QmoC